jgi:hypothetical protein
VAKLDDNSLPKYIERGSKEIGEIDGDLLIIKFEDLMKATMEIGQIDGDLLIIKFEDLMKATMEIGQRGNPKH